MTNSMNLNPDQDIKRIEDDKLGRAAFAGNLGSIIRNYNRPESFAIGICGKWGSGKTSVLNMALTEVEKDPNKNNVIFRFNPWLCSSVQQMVSQFFIQLKDLIATKRIYKELASLVEQYGDAISTISGIRPVLGNIVGGAIEAFKSYQGAKNDFENPKNIQKLKKAVADALEEKKLKIIVIIDDIDRLSKEEIWAVFQLVKALADFPYMFYVLAFDEDIVTQALSGIQGGGDNKEQGKAYLEKIIQVSIPLPEPNNSMIRELMNRIGNVVSFNEEEREQRFSDLEYAAWLLNGIVKSLRDVSRLVNNFTFNYLMKKEQVNPGDLLLLTSIQVFTSAAYDKLFAYGDVLCGSYLFDNEQIAEKQQKLFESLSQEKREWLESVLVGLFPHFAYHNGKKLLNNSCMYYNPKIAMEEKRIASPDCFFQYFGFSEIPIDFLDNSLESSRLKYQYSLIENIFSDNIRTKQLIIEIEEVDVTGWNHFLPLTETAGLLVQFAGDWQPEEREQEQEQQTLDNFCKAIFALADRLNEVDKYEMFSQLFRNQITHLDIAYLVMRDIRAGKLDLTDEQKAKLEAAYIDNCQSYRRGTIHYRTEAHTLAEDIRIEHIQRRFSSANPED